tara:strand:+ start:2245 stop:2898 length:654 start_codon:yes stop_codon:yes gene_type:complete
VKKITAIIPVRKGSVRVKNKNTKPFAGANLLKIKIEQLKQIPSIDKIVVSSDCDEMLKTAAKLGVDTHGRESYFASSEADNSEFFRNLGESIDGDHLMYSPVTCPLVSSETYQECIKRYQDEKVENLVTVAPVKHHMWLDGKPLNYDIDKSPNSQDLPDIYKITYGVCLISKKDMVKYANVVTKKPYFYVLDEIESVDIDTEFDFMVAELIYKKINS